MKILKASAGSGKTYQLSKHYIELLLRADAGAQPYRHILAVTFTNKATAEMKARILDDLAKLSGTNPRAKAVLTELLHDYGAFSVSTIDHFFQQALKAFSREIGQFADYQVELDKESLITEAMDRILDSLDDGSGELLAWIRDSLSDRLAEGERFRIGDGLKEIGKLLKNDEFRELSSREGAVPLFGKPELRVLRTRCNRIIRTFTDRAKALGFPVKSGEMLTTENKKNLFKAVPELQVLFDESWQRYATAWQIDKLIYRLGLAGEFDQTFKALLKEKNVLSLDESNILLRDIIDGSDAPFVYEKLGVRFEHFLLDEFQDTSHIQWENFKPLLLESESKTDAGDLIVGDVKQSIYRFRDTDWTLLGSRVKQDFPRAKEKSMEENWRSSRTVVGFNGEFFTYAAAQLGLQDIYADVRQIPRKEDGQDGSVRVSFLSEGQLEAVLASVREALDAGARPGDIAVLVRKNSQGGEIARFLIENGIEVISDDSLSVKSSIVVRRLVSLLSSYDNPEDQVGSFLAASLDISFPQEYHSLVDLCEELLRSMLERDPASFEGQALFIQAFLDDLQAWTETNGNKLRQFLDHFAESSSFIRSPENSDAVRVITIHKSKGLEFPYVIFPFAESVRLHPGEHENRHWCVLEDEELGGVYPVDLRKSAAGTLFSAALEQERAMELVDNLNLYYVALTRAGKCLHVISNLPAATKRKGLLAGKEEFGTVSEILYVYLGGQEEFRAGSPYDFRRMERKEEKPVSPFAGSYVSFPLAGRLAPSRDAHDFFSADGAPGAGSSPRLRGIVLHDILAEVRTPDELDAAVDAAVRDGRLDAAEGEKARTLLRAGIAAHADWFPAAPEGVEICNEMDLFAADGSVERPDRVILRGRQAILVDYKFGVELPSHRRQLQRYAGLWHELGYEISGAYLWYVEENKTVEVK